MLRMALTPLTPHPHPQLIPEGPQPEICQILLFLLASHSSCCYFLAMLLMRKQLSKINGFKLYLYVARIQNKLQNRNTFPVTKKSISLMLLFLEPASTTATPPPSPSPLVLKTFSALASAGFVQTFFRFLARETRFI